MALFRSDILNQDFFKRAVSEAERTTSVDILELTIGDGKTGIQEIVPVHITAKVRGRTRLFSWIAKISPSTEATVTITKELNLWEKEVYVYKEMFPAIELKSNKLHLNAPAHADLVFADINNIDNKGILLTDLSLAGFEPGNSSIAPDLATIELLMSQLAKFHAHSYDHVENIGKVPILEDNVPMAGKNIHSEDGLLDLLNSLQPANEDYSSRLKSLFSTEAYFDMCRRVFGARSGKFCAVCHGSPWLENSMVWRDREEVREVVYVNYQQARYAQPATDIAILLYTSTNKQFRLDNISRLLRNYHRTLMETLTALGHTGINVYPFSDLVNDYQDAIIPAVGVAVTVLPGLVRESQDEVDTGEDRPGITAGRLVSDKIDDIMEELAEAGII